MKRIFEIHTLFWIIVPTIVIDFEDRGVFISWLCFSIGIEKDHIKALLKRRNERA